MDKLRQAGFVALGAVMSLLVGGAAWAHGGSDDPNVIHGCYAKKDGGLRVVAEDTQCRHGELALDWNIEGRPGADGLRGEPGQDGEDGADGDDGAQGVPGTDGRTILNGTVDPTTEGTDGDFFLNTTTSTLFGPRAGGTWPAVGTSLVGPQGEPGAPGSVPPVNIAASLPPNDDVAFAGSGWHTLKTETLTVTDPSFVSHQVLILGGFSGSPMQNDVDTDVSLRFTVDGSATPVLLHGFGRQQTRSINGAVVSLDGSAVATLSPGPHTITLQAYVFNVTAGTTSTGIRVPDRNLIAIDLGPM